MWVVLVVGVVGVLCVCVAHAPCSCGRQGSPCDGREMGERWTGATDGREWSVVIVGFVLGCALVVLLANWGCQSLCGGAALALLETAQSLRKESC